MNDEPRYWHTAVLATALALLVLAAGCSSLSGVGASPAGTTVAGDDQVTTTSPAAGDPTDAATAASGTTKTSTTSPTDSTDTVAPAASDYPPGLNETGFENATAALAHHYSTLLAGPSHTKQATIDEGGGEVIGVVRVDTDGERAYMYESKDGSKTYERYYVDETMYIRNARTDPVSYENRTGSFERAAKFSEVVGIVTIANLTAPERTGDGSVRFEVDGFRPGTGQRWEDATGSVTIDPDGYIASFAITLEGESESISIEYRVEAVGETTVEAPDWLSKAN